MKKRLLSLLLATVVILGLSACKGKDGKETSVTDETSSAQGSSQVELTTEPLTFSQEEAEQLKEFLGEDAIDNFIEESTVPVSMAISDKLIDGEETEIEVELDSSGKPADSVMEKSFTDILKSGTYTSKFIISNLDANGKPVSDLIPLTTIVEGKKVYMEATMPADSGSIRCAFLFTPDGSYIIIPSMKAYMTFEDTGLGEDFNEMFSSIEQIEGEYSENTNYVSTAEVTFDGQTYICETYETEGNVSKYYSQDDNIKRIEMINADGNTTIIEVEEISPKADSSKLNLPSGYIDITTLMTENTFI